ncbi:alanine--tRNA ligase [Aminiphilus sp.]|uniref:alanine--tRNA ligase n=1 Tax=Aminiphilus sp. TaxID=1872488 RepID=UPI00260DF6F0|nr:alanine--tRNA ligase [Aminiphilus sp.]
MQWRKGRDLRELFLAYFEEKNSVRYPSFSLIPEDPTILFTIAGMVPFKPFFLGIRRPEVLRATTSQKCIRTNDIDNVGRTARHHTFFEMLGNFSFGDYFKKEIIPWSWEFLTERVGLDPNRLYATIYLDDDEAFHFWHTSVGLSKDRIVRLGEDDNFWAVGPVGPCGPCSEILYDQGPEFSCGRPDCAVGCSCDRYLEIWNLVFMQFNRNEAGELIPLPKQNIDTGMGLERLSSVVQRVKSDFETDLFKPLIDKACAISGTSYGATPRGDLAVRVISDHVRALAFMIADGILPANEGRGYVLRRLLRRAVRFGRLLGVDRPFLLDLLPTVMELMGDPYGELLANRATIESVISLEEQKFGRTLEQGSLLLETEVGSRKARGETALPGGVAFELYDTYGFPFELTQEICSEQGVSVDEGEFREEMRKQKERARAASKQLASTLSGTLYTELSEALGSTAFVGYDRTEETAEVKALVALGAAATSVEEGDVVEVLLARTPFYGERGGQVGDRGVLEGPSGRIVVEDTVIAAGTLTVHRGRVVSGAVSVGDSVTARIDVERRTAIRRHHTATHLLHEALIRVLGEHVRQAGSLVSPELLRFDFTHFAPVNPRELERVERIVNAQILGNEDLRVVHTTLDEAKKQGAKALFDEKYGEEVRVVSIPGFSTELCGGVHVDATGDIGLFKILREEGIGAGVRRITAVAGMPAVEHVLDTAHVVSELSLRLGGDPDQFVAKVEALQDEVKHLQKALTEERLRVHLARVESLVAARRDAAGISVVTGLFRDADDQLLRAVGDRIKAALSPVLVVFAGVTEEKVLFVAMADDAAVQKGAHAGNVVRDIARIAGGGGGGRAQTAQAGGKDPAKAEEALAAVPAVVEKLVSGK